MDSRSILLVGIGGAIGSSSRFIVSTFISETFKTELPLSTLIVNLSGSFLIGLLFALTLKFPTLSIELKLLLMSGFCGGFTTFSTFSMENYKLLVEGKTLLLLSYIVLSVAVGLIMFFTGFKLIK